MEAWSRGVVLDLLRRDVWDLAEVHTDVGIALVRYRAPVLSGRRVEGYERALKVVWPFAQADTGELPSGEESFRMGVFEDRLVEAVEHDAHAVLTAILTFDGARQWVFYTSDVHEFLARLEAMPQEAEPYPLELTTEEDPHVALSRRGDPPPVVPMNEPVVRLQCCEHLAKFTDLRTIARAAPEMTAHDADKGFVGDELRATVESARLPRRRA